MDRSQVWLAGPQTWLGGPHAWLAGLQAWLAGPAKGVDDVANGRMDKISPSPINVATLVSKRLASKHLSVI